MILLSKPLVTIQENNFLERCQHLSQKNIIPHLAILLVGDDPASQIYTHNKKKFMEKMGGLCTIFRKEASSSSASLINEIKTLANNPLIHGIIIQLPLPQHLNIYELISYVPAIKDVDGMGAQNIHYLYSGQKKLLDLFQQKKSESHTFQGHLPCTPKGIVLLLRHYGVTLEKKNILIMGRSLIVGQPLSLILTHLNATVTLAHSQTENLKSLTQNADIIIVAIGKGKFLTSEFLNKGLPPPKRPFIVDVGINRDHNGKLVGDVDFEDVQPWVQGITPVPGGVGPMTIVSLVDNLLMGAECNSAGPN